MKFEICSLPADETRGRSKKWELGIKRFQEMNVHCVRVRDDKYANYKNLYSTIRHHLNIHGNTTVHAMIRNGNVYLINDDVPAEEVVDV